MTLSACLIVKNEEDVLARCINSIKPFADEILVVDTGSSDLTCALAALLGVSLDYFPWCDDFAAARNYAFSRAHGDYILWADADDVFPPESAARIRAGKADGFGGADTVMLPYYTGFDAQGNVTFSYDRERIVRRGPQAHWVGAVHEVIVPFGRITRLDAPVHHKKSRPGEPGRNLRILDRLAAEGRMTGERERFYYARELTEAGRTAEAESQYRSLMETGDPRAPDRVQLCRDYARLLEARGDHRGALHALFSVLEGGAPPSEVCCAVGALLVQRAQYRDAVFWYELALRDLGTHRRVFHEPDSAGLVPCLQLCLCYDRLGDTRRAEQWNRRAALYDAAHPAVVHNAAFFHTMHQAPKL